MVELEWFVFACAFIDGIVLIGGGIGGGGGGGGGATLELLSVGEIDGCAICGQSN